MKGDGRPPCENLLRASFPGLEVREAESGTAPMLSGYFAVFNQWAKIDSVFEGRFMESIAPGAFAKTIGEHRSSMRILLNHGRDPSVGQQPIAAITELREDKQGAYYEGELLDGVPPLIVSGLRKAQYGSSFRFDVLRDDFEPRPKASSYNPEAIPERIIREARVAEFGPVTFPAYPGAKAGVRSLTDEFLLERYRDPRFAAGVLAILRDPSLNPVLNQSTAPSTTDAGSPSHLGAGVPRPERELSPLVITRNPKRRPRQ